MLTIRSRTFPLVLLLLWPIIGATGCRAPEHPNASSRSVLLDERSPGESMVRTELYFGMGRKDKPDVSEQEWRAFVDEVVTPRFPDGLTILDARGQYRGTDGVIRSEPSRILILLHAPDAVSGEKIELIRSEYKRRFDQESVLRIDSAGRTSF